jgi:hypothetical protein
MNGRLVSDNSHRFEDDLARFIAFSSLSNHNWLDSESDPALSHISGVNHMRTFASFALTLGLAAALAVPSYAQRQGGRGGFGQGGVGSLLANVAVQKELKMDKEQTDKATEAVKKVSDKHADARAKLRDLADEERRTKSAELNKVIAEETLTAVSEVLKPEQVKRLRQIELQRAGVNAFTRPEVEKGLSFTDEQKSKVKAVVDENGAKMRELSGRPGAGGARPPRGQGGANPNAEKITALRKESTEKIMAILTDDQKKSWKDMTGEAFEVPPMRTVPKKDD